jgi:hypothetical protein
MIEQRRPAMAIDTGEPTTDAASLRAYVIATTDAGTRAALEATRQWAIGLNAEVVLLVPFVIPYAEPLDAANGAVTFVANRYRLLAETIGIDILVRVCVCRPHSAELMPLLPPGAIVLIGGATRRWWPTREERLATRLGRSGYRALLVGSADRSRAVPG